jgi:methylated-DNA-[protein]-cysteine S-methyltransferase
MSTTNRRTWTSYESPLGTLTLTATGRELSGLFFPGRGPTRAEADHRSEPFEQAIDQLDEYFAGHQRRFDLPLDLSAGTPFQRTVWSELQAIPYGETITYGELAHRIGRPDRIRAVGAAVGRNPLPIIVPCHRVIAADGHLTGYLGGLHRKQALLDTENAVRHGSSSTIAFGTRQLALLTPALQPSIHIFAAASHDPGT